MSDAVRILLLADSHLGFDLPVRPRVERRRRGHDFLANYASALQPALDGEVDIVVHAPEYEGFGLVMLEAMAASRPLVVNDAPGGMRELVQHGVNGLVATAGSPIALAEVLLKVVVSPSLRHELGENGRRICEERYSAEVMARRTQEVYEELLRPAKYLSWPRQQRRSSAT